MPLNNQYHFKYFMKNFKDASILPNISDLPGTVMRTTEYLSWGFPVVLYTETGMPFSAQLYKNAADVGLPQGPAVLAMYPSTDGLVYQSITLSQNDLNTCLQNVIKLLQNQTPDSTQLAETAKILRQNINSRAAEDMLRSLSPDNFLGCMPQIITATGSTIEAEFVKRNDQYCLYCNLDDDQVMELHISAEEAQDMPKVIDTFCDSFDEYWKQVDIEAMEQEEFNQDDQDIDEI